MYNRPYKGHDAYRHALFGDTITVERRISRVGASSSYALKDSAGRVQGRKREDLDAMLSTLGLNAANPVCVMTQDTARNFLAGSSNKVGLAAAAGPPAGLELLPYFRHFGGGRTVAGQEGGRLCACAGLLGATPCGPTAALTWHVLTWPPCPQSDQEKYALYMEATSLEQISYNLEVSKAQVRQMDETVAQVRGGGAACAGRQPPVREQRLRR